MVGTNLGIRPMDLQYPESFDSSWWENNPHAWDASFSNMGMKSSFDWD